MSDPPFPIQEAPDPATPIPLRPAAETTCLLILTLLAIFAVLSTAAEIVIPLLLAAMLNLLLQPAMRFLCDTLRLPLAASALLLILALGAILTALGIAIALPASGWIAKAPQGLRTLEDQLYLLRGPISAMQYLVQRAEGLAGIMPPAAGQAAAAGPNLAGVGLSVLLGTQQFFGRLLVLVVTLFFMLSAGDSTLRAFVEIVPGFGNKRDVVHIVKEIERNVSGYLATITSMNAAIGILTGAALWLCGLSDALLWGTVAFALNFIPIIGPLIGVSVIFAVGLLTFGDALRALLPAAIYLALHVVESQAITPHLLARRFTLSPLMVIVSLFFWNWLWGVPGALLSVPLLATIKIVCDRIPTLAALGHLLGASARKSTA